MTNNLFNYYHQGNQASIDLYMFHGTGGDEFDLLPLIKNQEDFNIISLRGNISENGMNRFFKRNDSGIFDQNNIKEETSKLHQFIIGQSSNKSKIALGYSNGANFILSTIFYYPTIFTKVILLHPMLPFIPKPINLSNLSALVTFGNRDNLISPRQSRQVVKTLQSNKATVTIHETPSDHQINPTEIEQIHRFLA